MSIFTRFKDIVGSSLDALLEHSDNPSRTLRLAIQEMEDALVEMKSSCAQEMAERMRAVRTAESLAEEGRRWMDRAELAVSRGREDMAREALLRKKNVLSAAQVSEAQARESAEKIRVSQEEIAGVEAKLREARERYAALRKDGVPPKPAPAAESPQGAAPSDDIERELSEIRARLNNTQTK